MVFICLLAIFVKANETDSEIDLKLKIDDLVSNNDYGRKSHRELRGRGGGRSSRYSGSRSYYRGSTGYRSMSPAYAKTNNYKYSYSTYKNPTTYSNSYYSVTTKRTSRPLYVYYRAPNYFNAAGYRSSYFLLVYYDGYGYNFYYGRYGYYEYSVNQTPEGEDPLVGAIITGVCLLCSCGMIAYCIYESREESDEEEEYYGSEYGSEEVIEEEVVIEEKHHDGQPGYEGGPGYP